MLTRAGWFVLGLGIVTVGAGSALHYRELVVLGLALLACLAVALVMSLLRPEFEVRRDIVPQRVSEGEGSAAILTVINTSKRRSPNLVARDTVAGERVTVTVPALASGEEHTSSLMIPTTTRGVYTVGPLDVSHSDPFDLVQVSQGLGAMSELIVHPRWVRVVPLPTGRSQDLEGPTQAGAPRGGIAFHSLREYAPGDDLRLIHWRSTAKTGTLMVRHTVITNEPRLLIVLDTSRASYENASEFEEAVRIVASMVAAGGEKRFPTEFHATNGATQSMDPTGQGRTLLFDLLASLQLSDDDPGLAAMGRLASRREHGVSLGVVTGLPTRERVAIVGRMAGRYAMTTLVQVGDHLKHPPVGLGGVLSMSVESVEQFQTVWKSKVG